MWKGGTKGICDWVQGSGRVKDAARLSHFRARKIPDFKTNHYSTAFSHQVSNTLTRRNLDQDLRLPPLPGETITFLLPSGCYKRHRTEEGNLFPGKMPMPTFKNLFFPTTENTTIMIFQVQPWDMSSSFARIYLHDMCSSDSPARESWWSVALENVTKDSLQKIGGQPWVMLFSLPGSQQSKLLSALSQKNSTLEILPMNSNVPHETPVTGKHNPFQSATVASILHIDTLKKKKCGTVEISFFKWKNCLVKFWKSFFSSDF